MSEIAELATLFSAKMVEQKEMSDNMYDLVVCPLPHNLVDSRHLFVTQLV